MKPHPDDNYISILMDDVAKLLVKRGLSAPQVRDHMDFESMRIETEILDGEFDDAAP